MFRSTIFASAILAMIALVSAAPGHDNHGGKEIKKVNAGGDAGLLNINPGKHLLIDDVVLKHVLNDVIDINIIRLQEVLKNVAILSGNNAHHSNAEGFKHSESHHEDHYDGDHHDEDNDDEDC